MKKKTDEYTSISILLANLSSKEHHDQINNNENHVFHLPDISNKSKEKMAKKEFERLPKIVKPISYDLHLHPNLETFKVQSILFNYIQLLSLIYTESLY